MVEWILGHCSGGDPWEKVERVSQMPIASFSPLSLPLWCSHVLVEDPYVARFRHHVGSIYVFEIVIASNRGLDFCSSNQIGDGYSATAET